jgi:hypothetical protein
MDKRIRKKKRYVNPNQNNYWQISDKYGSIEFIEYKLRGNVMRI